MANPQVVLRQRPKQSQTRRERSIVRTADQEKQERGDGGHAVVCVRCEHVITRSSERAQVKGKHEHTCLNPEGIVFHIACFHTAAGCRAEGGVFSYWSWFPGHSWQVVLCSGCLLHLGWLFHGNRSHFYGLIVKRLREVAEHGSDDGP